MNRNALIFERPEHLAATMPANSRGIERDEIRLMVSTPSGHNHSQFLNLPHFLQNG